MRSHRIWPLWNIVLSWPSFRTRQLKHWESASLLIRSNTENSNISWQRNRCIKYSPLPVVCKPSQTRPKWHVQNITRTQFRKIFRTAIFSQWILKPFLVFVQLNFEYSLAWILCYLHVAGTLTKVILVLCCHKLEYLTFHGRVCLVYDSLFLFCLFWYCLYSCFIFFSPGFSVFSYARAAYYKTVYDKTTPVHS